MDDFTLDDAHEALSVAAWMLERLSPWKFAPVGRVVAEALDAIEAQLPEPCEHCGSDQCRLFRWPSSEMEPTRECEFPPVTISFEDGP